MMSCETGASVRTAGMAVAEDFEVISEIVSGIFVRTDSAVGFISEKKRRSGSSVDPR